MTIDRVAIIGSHTYPLRADIDAFVAALSIGTVVVSGGANGPDTWAVETAKANGLTTIIHWPDKARYGVPAAFYHRNVKIVEDATRVVAFAARDPKTKAITAGTTMTIDLARKAGIPVEVIETPVPARICVLIERANRYLANADGAPTNGEWAARARNVTATLGDIGEEIRKLETKMHAGWEYTDALSEGADKQTYTDTSLIWLTGYQLACDYVDRTQRHLDATAERLTA